LGLPQSAASADEDTVVIARPAEPEVSLSVQVGRKEQVDERLLALFHNRAELKKEFADLRNERDRLIEMLAEQKSLTDREQQRMRALEKRLADPETGYTALVYYQLRAMWDACHEQLKLFRTELMKQQEDRERKRVLMEFNRAREERLQELNGRLAAVRAQTEAKKSQVADVEAQMQALRGFWNYFRRRALQPELEARKLEHENVREQIERLLDERISIESEECPEPKGLGVEGRRLVNLALLALTQHLYLHFSENSLAQLARGAVLKSLKDQHYGMRSDCEHYMAVIAEAVEAMQAQRGHGQQLKVRANGLRTRVRYKSDTDATPVADSVDGIPLQPEETDFGGLVQVNVLTDNYWNVLDLIMR
jgi:hypothetical protein